MDQLASLLPGPLVDATWLAANLDAVAVADVRHYLDGRSARDAYAAGHLPGAVFVDLDTDLAGAASTASGRHPLPRPDDFATAMGRLGIGDTTLVVAYDDAGGSIAARLWWLLHVLGHPAAVLDGGIDAWSGPLETTPAHPTPASFTPRPWPSTHVVDGDQLSALLGAGSTDIIDARSSDRYRGTPNALDPRPGHVPGARSKPWAANLDTSGRFLDAAELTRHYGDVEPGTDVVVYCGSGVTACHDLLALAIIGRRGRLYAGSWSQWAADPRRDVEVYDTPPASP